jgi:endo-1,4-beta-xylanase
MNKTLSSIGIVLALAISATCLAQSLREEADKRGILIGAAVNPRLFNEGQYSATLVREFNMIEAENVMKWRAIRPSRDTFNFEPGDAVVKFAKEHKMKVRGHCLLWSEYNPDWIVKGNFTPEQMAELLREHITKVMSHFSGEVFAWDVVNESFLENGSIETSIWYDTPGIGLKGKGTAYIEQAFRWARAVDPKAKLFYNDYDAEGLNAKSDAIYAMVKDFKKRGVPIDGVGLQMHINNYKSHDLTSLAANIKRLADLGLEVHITEMDVALPVDAQGVLLDQSDLEQQAKIYRHVMATCLQFPKCTTVQTWGFTDKYSWIPGFSKGQRGLALPFTKTYERKPAYEALLDALKSGPR